MKRILFMLVATCLLAGFANAAISYTGGTLSENFDSIGATGTAMPTGWIAGGAIGAINEMDPPYVGFRDETLVVGDGSSGTKGVMRSLGTVGDSDRAIGGSNTSGWGDCGIQVALINDTGAPLTSINLTYTGEQWRDYQGHVGSAGNYSPPYEHAVNEKLIVYISDTADYGGSGYVERLPAEFEFIAPQDNGLNAALDGNAAANRVTGLGGEYTLVNPIAAGATLYILWFDFENDATSDHYLAIDNVSFVGVPEPMTLSLLGLGGLALLRRRRA